MFVPDEAQEHICDDLGGCDDGALWLVEDSGVVLNITDLPHESRDSPAGMEGEGEEKWGGVHWLSVFMNTLYFIIH